MRTCRMRRKRLIRPTKYCKFKYCRNLVGLISAAHQAVLRLYQSQHRLRAVLCFLRQAFFRRPETPFPPLFQFIDYSHKKYGTPFANNLTSLSGVINDQPRTIAQEIAYADVATQAANLQKSKRSWMLKAAAWIRSAQRWRFPERRRRAKQRYRRPGDVSATSNNDSATVSANSQAQAGATRFSLSNWRRGSKPRSVWARRLFRYRHLRTDDGRQHRGFDLSAADQNGDGDGFIDASEW